MGPFISRVTIAVTIITFVPLCHTSHGTSPQKNDYLGSINSYRKLFTASLGQVVWQNLNDRILHSISHPCAQEIQNVLWGLKNNSVNAYTLLDASSKSPSGILDGTISSYGDYDQCLRDFGTFCMLRFQIHDETTQAPPNLPDASGDDAGTTTASISDIKVAHLPKSEHLSREQESSSSLPSSSQTLQNLQEEPALRPSSQIFKSLENKIPVFAYFYLNLGLCMPSKCSSNDVLTVVQMTLTSKSNLVPPLPLKIYRNITCDTSESITLPSRVQVSQLVAGSFVLFMVTLTVIGTLSKAILRFIGDGNCQNDHSHLSSLLRLMGNNFCLISNSKSLLSRRSTQQSRLALLDYLRLVVIVAGITGHCLSCLETVPGWYLIARLYEIKAKFKLFLVQPLLNEAGLGLVTFLGGLATYFATADSIWKGTFSYKFAIFDRWIRYMPSLMSMVALDILWPLTGSGPLFTQISIHLLDKCSRFYWMNFLFLNNFRSAPDNCIPHTFYSGIDLQLFILGLLVILLMSKNAKLGIWTLVLLILLGNGSLIYATYYNSSSPVLIDAEATVPKTLNYLNYVHFATYGHFSNYMIGILVGHLLKNPSILKNHSRLLKAMGIITSVISVTIHFAPALHNTFGLVTPNLVPVFIVSVKFCYAFYYAVFLLQSVAKASEEPGERKRIRTSSTSRGNSDDGCSGGSNGKKFKSPDDNKSTNDGEDDEETAGEKALNEVDEGEGSVGVAKRKKKEKKVQLEKRRTNETSETRTSETSEKGKSPILNSDEKSEKRDKFHFLRQSFRQLKARSTLSEIMMQMPIISQQLTMAVIEVLDESSILKIISNCSYSLYIVNYAFIRHDFFTSRVHMDLAPYTLYSILRRFTYTMLIVFGLAYAFHVIFVIPFDRIRRSFFILQKKPVNNEENTCTSKAH